MSAVNDSDQTARRVRSSKSRDARYYSACQSLCCKWRDAMRAHKPLHETHATISEWIASLDVTIEQRRTLMDKHWALRDFAVIAHARWQLYLDGTPRTFDEIADAAEDEHEHIGPKHDARLAVMQRICGRHEWDDSHDPFYASDDSTTKPL